MSLEDFSEVVLSDLNDLQVVLKPALEFRPESFSLAEGVLLFIGAQQNRTIQLPPEFKDEDLTDVSRLFLIEVDGSGSRTETDLVRD